MKLKGRVLFRQCIPENRKRYGIKLYELCDGNGYTHDLAAYLGEQLLNTASNITPTRGTVLQLTMKVKSDGHV